MKRILISNDDGIHAAGIKALTEALKDLGEITVVAPVSEQSASSHALTLHHPIRVNELGPRMFAVEGTPTDCVLLAINEFMDERPDIVVSGINQGPNLGEDVIYSGTVAAATEGAILGVPSLAVSLASYRFHDFKGAAAVTAMLVGDLLEKERPDRLLLNVNIPPVPRDQIRGIRVTQLGTRVYEDVIRKKADPRGKDQYWIGGGEPSWTPSPDSDFAAVSERYVSLTPILMDLTDTTQLGLLQTMNFRWDG